MDNREKKAIEDAGFHVTTVREFLDLTDAENELVELRVAISLAVREAESAGVTQSQLAERVESSQPRIARIEAAGPGVSLDLMFRSYFALGGKFAPPSSRPAVAGGTVDDGLQRGQGEEDGRHRSVSLLAHHPTGSSSSSSPTASGRRLSFRLASFDGLKSPAVL